MDDADTAQKHDELSRQQLVEEVQQLSLFAYLRGHDLEMPWRNCDTSDVIPEWDGADLAWEVYARPAKISVSRRRLVSTWLGRKLLISNAFKPILVTSLLVMLFTRFFTPGVSVELATDVPATAICGATMKMYYDLRQPLEFDICRSLVMCWCTFLVMHVVNRDLILSEVTTFESAWMITNCVVSEVALLLNRHSIWDEPHVYNWEWQLGDILRFLSYLPLFVMLCATTDSLRMNKFVKMVCLCIGLSYHLMEYVKARYSTSEWCSGSEFLGMDCREFKNAYQWTMLNITIFMLKALKSYAFGQAFAVVKAAYFKEKTLVAKHMNSGDHWLESFSRGQWLKGTPPQAPRDEEDELQPSKSAVGRVQSSSSSSDRAQPCITGDQLHDVETGKAAGPKVHQDHAAPEPRGGDEERRRKEGSARYLRAVELAREMAHMQAQLDAAAVPDADGPVPVSSTPAPARPGPKSDGATVIGRQRRHVVGPADQALGGGSDSAEAWLRLHELLAQLAGPEGGGQGGGAAHAPLGGLAAEIDWAPAAVASARVEGPPPPSSPSGADQARVQKPRSRRGSVMSSLAEVGRVLSVGFAPLASSPSVGHRRSSARDASVVEQVSAAGGGLRVQHVVAAMELSRAARDSAVSRCSAAVDRASELEGRARDLDARARELEGLALHLRGRASELEAGRALAARERDAARSEVAALRQALEKERAAAKHVAARANADPAGAPASPEEPRARRLQAGANAPANPDAPWDAESEFGSLARDLEQVALQEPPCLPPQPLPHPGTPHQCGTLAGGACHVDPRNVRR